MGKWVPSTEVGANIKRPAGFGGTIWRCDYEKIIQLVTVPSDIQPYRTQSVYYGGGSGFWVLNCDATIDPRDEAWHPLRFDHSFDDYSSYLTQAGGYPTLRVQRKDQQWPGLLLPDIYHTGHRTDSLKCGGLTGDISLFLALVVFSIPRESLLHVLPTMYHHRKWYTHSNHMPRMYFYSSLSHLLTLLTNNRYTSERCYGESLGLGSSIFAGTGTRTFREIL